MMKLDRNFLLAVFGLAAACTSDMAAAGDLNDVSLKDAPPPGVVMDNGRGWMVRGRVLGVIPDEDGSGLSPAGVDVSIDNSVVPELDLTYFLSRNLAIEVIAGVTPHEITGKGVIAGADVGEVWLLPPTVLLQYHFDIGRGIKPYVGIGVNYTVFFGEDEGPAVTSLDFEDSWGWALQAGVDIPLRDNWYLNVDVKKLWIQTEATAVTGGGTVTGDVDIDPWIVGVGLGYRFGGPLLPLR